MRERDIFDERQELKRANFACPFCRERHEYDVRWLRRTKKRRPPAGLNEQQKAQFARSRDYMVRIDDTLSCRNPRCRKRFDIPVSQSVVFVQD
jgi:sarcosine oxidase delta subunit